MAKLQDKKSSGSGGHWYYPDGKSCHTVPTANGKSVRKTNISDARKLGLLPSPTSILQIQAKPQLVRWGQEQVGIAAFDNRPAEGEDEKAYAKRMVALGYKGVSAAAEFGSEWHEVMENVANGEPCPEEWKIHIDPALAWKDEKGIQFVEREKVVVNLSEGYAGTMDIAARGKNGEKMVVDWKTRKTYAQYDVKPYEGQILQIAAYAACYWGVGPVKAGEVFGVNAYVSSTEPGRFVPCGYTGEEISAAYDVFLNLCAIWRWDKAYDPRGK